MSKRFDVRSSRFEVEEIGGRQTAHGKRLKKKLKGLRLGFDVIFFAVNRMPYTLYRVFIQVFFHLREKLLVGGGIGKADHSLAVGEEHGFASGQDGGPQ